MGVVMSLGGVCLGGFVTTVAVSNWFVVKRGRALGIATMGGSFGTMLLPVLASLMIESWGWRQTWFVMGVAVLILVIPAALFVRRRPEDMGLQPDGFVAPSEGTAAPTLTLRQRQRRDELIAADVVWTRRDAIRTPVLWVMVFAWGFHVFSVTGANVHMVPFFQDLGAPLLVAAAAVSVRSATSLVAHPLWGIVIDRIPVKPAASLQFLITALGIGMWLLPPSVPTLVAGLMLFGIGGGGGAVVSEMIWSGFFGRISLGTVRGLAYPLQNALGAVGPLAIGLLYDISGGYASSFAVLASGSIVAAMLVQLAQPPRPPAARRASDLVAREP
jgi:MFS family permease